MPRPKQMVAVRVFVRVCLETSAALLVKCPFDSEFKQEEHRCIAALAEQHSHSQALAHTFATGLRSDTELGVPRVPRVKSNTAVACTTQPPQSPSSVQSREQSARGRCVCDTKSEQQLPTNLQRLVLFQLLLQSRDLSNKNIN